MISKKIVFVLAAGCLTIFFSCAEEEQEAGADSPGYRRAVADFYISLGASQTDQARFAFNKMNDVAEAFPQEAAAWANLAVYALRQGNFELATDRIGRALELQPDHEDVLFIAGIIESRRGDVASSIGYLKRAREAGPENPRILYMLAQELEREDDTANADDIRDILEQLHELIPGNRAVLIELVRVGVKEQDAAIAGKYLEKLESHSGSWQPAAREQLGVVRELLAEEAFSDLALELSFLRSGLESSAAFQEDLLQIRLPQTDVGYLIPEFISLPAPTVNVAPPDTGLILERRPIERPEGATSWLKGVTLLEEAPPFPVSVTDGELMIDEEVHLPFPGNADEPIPLHAVTEIDYNYSFRNDLALAGSDGFRLYRQESDRTFTDVTAETGINNTTINRSYYGVWAFDLEMDGDLDLLLAPQNGPPAVLRNNGDGTFTEAEPFGGVSDVRGFLWVDLTGDGAPEAVFLTEEGVVLSYPNERGGRFGESTSIAGDVAAVAAGDLDADGRFDIITVSRQGILNQHTLNQRTRATDTQRIAVSGFSGLQTEETRLFVADVDNNGGLDLVLSTPEQARIWLAGTDQTHILLEKDLPGGITDLFDMEGNERLDLLGIDPDMNPFFVQNEGTKGYFARSIRARASGELGDQRINSFGIGGEMEIRSGLLYQKQLISSPIVHFGLGEYEEAEMLRIIWPNGSVQAEFAELGMGSTIFNEQILKGSCPWLFANNGEEIGFVTDALWRSPLGLRINAQETAGVIQTYDRVKIRGDQLRPVDGEYDLRMTAELWETHFFDYAGLVAVDHPVDTEIFVDERFVFPAPDLSTRLMTTPQPVASVRDEDGRDWTDRVSAEDGIYIRPFRKTAYQGVVEEHSIRIELADSEPSGAPWLVLSGWLRPTDSSINLALSQGSIDPPRGLRVEVSGGDGEWKLLHEDYGIPAGKHKTILLDLEGVFSDSDSGRRLVRLTTTSEIYWDAILQAERLNDADFREIPLEPVKQTLRYRGFSEWNRADEMSPLVPDYAHISGTAQRWRDLEGFHTRFGDVSELLAGIDDRYVMMNAGDEMQLRYRAPGPPPEGYTRSFIFVSDGWVKDGDYNTEASATVLPLPYHGQADYEYSRGGSLFDDPVYQKNPDDWVNYHTRYITSHGFRQALRFEE